MIVKDFTTSGGHECASCHQEPLFLALCLCGQWYCEEHYGKHYGRCPAFIARTTPRSIPS